MFLGFLYSFFYQFLTMFRQCLAAFFRSFDVVLKAKYTISIPSVFLVCLIRSFNSQMSFLVLKFCVKWLVVFRVSLSVFSKFGAWVYAKITFTKSPSTRVIFMWQVLFDNFYLLGYRDTNDFYMTSFIWQFLFASVRSVYTSNFYLKAAKDGRPKSKE